jgi:hypothetical protein
VAKLSRWQNTGDAKKRQALRLIFLGCTQQLWLLIRREQLLLSSMTCKHRTGEKTVDVFNLFPPNFRVFNDPLLFIVPVLVIVSMRENFRAEDCFAVNVFK